MPDDLVPIFLDYLGDVYQSPKDLENSNCFFKVEYEPYYWNRTLGHYCAICKKLYLLKGTAGLKRHLKSAFHQSMFKKRGYKWIPPSKKEIHYWFKKKHYRYRCWDTDTKTRTINSVKYFNINLNDISK